MKKIIYFLIIFLSIQAQSNEHAIFSRTLNIWSYGVGGSSAMTNDCSAMFIANNLIITAAHCLKHENLKLMIPEYNTSLSKDDRTLLKDLVDNKKYKLVIDEENDVAVIKLSKKLTISSLEKFKLADISKLKDIHNRFLNREKNLRLFMLGVRKGEYSDDATMPISAECPLEQINYGNAQIKLLCTGFPGNSGALLILPEKNKNETIYKIVGVVTEKDTTTHFIRASTLSQNIINEFEEN